MRYESSRSHDASRSARGARPALDPVSLHRSARSTARQWGPQCCSSAPVPNAVHRRHSTTGERSSASGPKNSCSRRSSPIAHSDHASRARSAEKRRIARANSRISASLERGLSAMMQSSSIRASEPNCLLRKWRKLIGNRLPKFSRTGSKSWGSGSGCWARIRRVNGRGAPNGASAARRSSGVGVP